jgi:hypothetical protein
MSYVRTYDPDFGSEGGSRIEAEDAQIAIDILMLEVVAVGAAGGLLFVLSTESDDNDEAPSQMLS